MLNRESRYQKRKAVEDTQRRMEAARLARIGSGLKLNSSMVNLDDALSQAIFAMVVVSTFMAAMPRAEASSAVPTSTHQSDHDHSSTETVSTNTTHHASTNSTAIETNIGGGSYDLMTKTMEATLPIQHEAKQEKQTLSKNAKKKAAIRKNIPAIEDCVTVSQELREVLN